MADRILDGIRLIDLSSGLAGPVATRLLAEAGADVIKVEPPSGDWTRERASFASWNRSKRSAVLDLDSAADRDKLESLLAGADVLVHNYPPSQAAAFGLDDAGLVQRFPSLVVCSILGYPVNHPDAERSDHDLLVQARSGLMGEFMGYREGPVALRFPMPSWAAAYLGAAGVLTRLLVREGTGHGGSVHTSLLQGMLQTVSLFWNRAERPIATLFSSKEDQPPQLAMYECADGAWLQIMNPAERIDLSALPLVREVVAELAEADPTVGGRELNTRGATLDADLFKQVMRARTSEQWLAALRAGDVAVEPILTMGQMLDMPLLKDNDYVVEVDDPQWGRTLQAAAPFRTEPPSAVVSAAPRLGEHTAEVLERSVPDKKVGQPAGRLPEHPLTGLRVVDLGSYLAGPMAPMLMGDLGADVIKVEPLYGDRQRYLSLYWEACARGKRGIAVDLGTEAGQEVLTRLVEWADIVHHNQRPGPSAKLGIDEAGLRRRNPDVVFGYVSSYGERGDRVGWPGFDTIYEALGGWEAENGGEGNLPMFSRFGCLDVQTALASTVSTLLAQYHKAHTGNAGKTSGSLLGTTAMTQSETLLRLGGPGGPELAPYPRLTQDQTGIGPGERIYQVSDGWVAVVARGEKLASLRAVASVAADVVADADVEAAIEQGLASRTSEDVLAALDAAGVPAEPVLEGEIYRFFDRQDYRDAGLIAQYPHAAFVKMEQPGAFWHFPDMTLTLDRAAPVIGEHTREILVELGYTPAEIDQLYSDGIVDGPTIPPYWEL